MGFNRTKPPFSVVFLTSMVFSSSASVSFRFNLIQMKCVLYSLVLIGTFDLSRAFLFHMHCQVFISFSIHLAWRLLEYQLLVQVANSQEAIVVWDFLYLSVYPSLLRLAILSNLAPTVRVSRLCCFAYTQINDKLAFCKDRGDCAGTAGWCCERAVKLESTPCCKSDMSRYAGVNVIRVRCIKFLAPRHDPCFYSSSRWSRGRFQHTPYRFTRLIHCSPKPKIVLIKQSVLN